MWNFFLFYATPKVQGPLVLFYPTVIKTYNEPKTVWLNLKEPWNKNAKTFMIFFCRNFGRNESGRWKIIYLAEFLNFISELILSFVKNQNNAEKGYFCFNKNDWIDF